MDFNPVFQCYSLGGRNGLTFVERTDETPIDKDGDFECKRLSCFMSRAGGAAQTEETRQIPTGVLFNIRDSSTGRTLFNGFADTGELFGDGRVPFVLPTSHFFKRGGLIQILYAPAADQGPDFNNGSLWLIMIGAKNFKE